MQDHVSLNTKTRFGRCLQSLKEIAANMDKDATLAKKDLLQTLSSMELPSGKYLPVYNETLLFLCAYAGNATLRRFAENELKRIALHLKKNYRTIKKSLPENSGLPYTETITSFSPDSLGWLLKQKEFSLYFDSFYNPKLTLNEVLNITLPSLLKAETTAGLNPEDLLEVFGLKPGQYLDFVHGQLESLKEFPQAKDLLSDGLNLFVQVVPRSKQFSRSYNRIPHQPVYYHQDMLKRFDHTQLINEPLPHEPVTPEKIMGYSGKEQLVKVIKYAMSLTEREIDPATYLQEDSMRYIVLERGLTMAIYGMYPERQLPLETYTGFTIFKNGLPVSYGGMWVFGNRSKVGFNVFEPYRGGESGYLLCQLLRVYKQYFNISYFEVEPFQFGADNEDAIASGAFWFYYKFGFRPVDKEISKQVELEQQIIKSRKNYRSSAKTLIGFTGGNIALNLGNSIPADVIQISTQVLNTIKKDWKNNYRQARKQAVEIFCKRVHLNSSNLSVTEIKIMEDLALWAMAMKITNKQKLELMKQMVFRSTTDLYAYQQLLRKFFEK
ncbi:MAG: hypothetical protein IPL54_00215 [Chitinophagaceae bacterium]|nr:hypothetical protein [Chitinophagaceae bacterium]